MPNLRELRNRLTWRIGARKKVAVEPQPTSSARLLEILATHEALSAKFEDAARNGSVADALPLSLYANYVEQLGEWRRQFADEQLGFETCLRRRHLNISHAWDGCCPSVQQLGPTDRVPVKVHPDVPTKKESRHDDF